MAHALVLEPNSVFASDYRVVRPLSEGGMGAVYLVEQISTGSPRALKVMHEHLVADEKFRKRFVQEARVCSRIRSDHVVQVIAAGIDTATSTPWLVMELLEGRDLLAHVRERGALALAEVREICGQLCHALAAAHSVGVVHRDLKPDNVFLSEARREGASFTLKVLDFGIAKILSEAQPSTTTTAIGTPLWMAPEQTDVGAFIGPSTDVWALGLMVFWMLTGRCYWRVASQEQVSAMALMREVVFEPLIPASQRAAEFGAEAALPKGFDHWFGRCVVRETGQRYEDASQARAELMPLLGDTSTAGAAFHDASLQRPSPSVPRAVVGVVPSNSLEVVTAATQLLQPTPVGLPETTGTAPAVSESLPPASEAFRPPRRHWGRWAIGGGVLVCLLIALVVSRGKPTGGNLGAECERGSSGACVSLARAYEHGAKKTPRSLEKAAHFYHRACLAGDYQSCVTAGTLYQTGEGVTRDDEKAAAAFSRACTGGEPAACRNLGVMTLKGDGVPRSEARALWAFSEGCNRGDREACTRAAEMYRDGQGTSPDLDRAREYYHSACFRGDSKACVELKKIESKSAAPP